MAEPEEQGEGGKLEGKRMPISNRTKLNHGGEADYVPDITNISYRFSDLPPSLS